MAYTPTTWNRGDTVTSTKLNKLEQGVANAGSALVVNLTSASGTLTMDKTYAEIYDAFKNGVPCYVKQVGSVDDPIDSQYNFIDSIEPITVVYKYNNTYRIYTATAQYEYLNDEALSVPAVHVFQASISTDYPTFFYTVYPPAASVVASPTWG